MIIYKQCGKAGMFLFRRYLKSGRIIVGWVDSKYGLLIAAVKTIEDLILDKKSNVIFWDNDWEVLE